MIPVPLSDIEEIHRLSERSSHCSNAFQSAFYKGKFVLPKNSPKEASTFLDPSGFYRGIALLNGFNLGRYWPIAGPQVTLFVPASVLNPNPQENVLTLLELEKAPCMGTGNKGVVKFVENPVLDGSVPTYAQKTVYVDFSELYLTSSDSTPSFVTVSGACVIILTLITLIASISCLN